MVDDFRSDLPKIDVPVLVLHGTEDRIPADGGRAAPLASHTGYSSELLVQVAARDVQALAHPWC